MKFFTKSKAIALFLAVVVVAGNLFAIPNTAKAADESSYIELINLRDSVATANTTVNNAFEAIATSYAAIEVVVPKEVGMSITITRSSDSYTVYSDTITSLEWDYDTDGTIYYMVTHESMAAGEYNIALTFDADTTYSIFGLQAKPAASISNSSIILTKGFSQKLSVTGSTVSNWTSSNSKVAAVDKNGKVTGKSTGTATITATTTDGQLLTCHVSVKANAYTGSAPSINNCSYGNAYIGITKVSYNKKGDLVIKATYLNNSGHKITALTNIKLTVKNKSGKVIGTYSKKKASTTILQGGKKSFTYTIKKSQLKQKSTQDLRNATIKPVWKYNYRY